MTQRIASIDLFVVPTIAFEQLFACLVLGHKRRQLLWFAVTYNPTAEWLARQITEAFPWDTAAKYLIRDNDRAFGAVFQARVRATHESEFSEATGDTFVALNVGGEIIGKFNSLGAARAALLTQRGAST